MYLGGIFLLNDILVAYVGKELSSKEIRNLLGIKAVELTKDSDDDTYKEKIVTNDDAIFGQTNWINLDDDYKFPYIFDEKLLYVVDAEDFWKVAEKYENTYGFEYDTYHELLPFLIKDYDNEAYKILQMLNVNCNYVLYDMKTKELTALKIGTKCDLYFGYTKQFGEIIFSNKEDIIQKLCGKVYEFPDNTYYKNGEFHNFLEEEKEEIIYENADVFFKQENQKNKPLFDDLMSAKNLLNCLNEILSNITDTSVRARIEKSFNDYFDSLEPKKRVSEYVDSAISIEVQKHLLEIIKAEVEKFSISNTVIKEIYAKYRDLIDKIVTSQAVPKINIIKLNDVEIGRTDIELFHEKYEEIASSVQLDEPVMLIGPAGSGKNHVIAQIAKAFGQKMYYTNNVSNEFKLTGFIDAGGNYRDTEFYKAFKYGGIFFLDEIDNSDPSALIIINSALANGYMAFPHETIEKHPIFRMIAAANTWGKGADLQYIGRTALDGATLDRFDNIFFDYDRKLEKALYPNRQVLEFMWAFRDSVEKSKIPHIISTRGIGKVYKKEINGIPVETILRNNVVKNLDQDDLNIIIGNMDYIDENNKYYSVTKSLRLIKEPQRHDDELPF